MGTQIQGEHLTLSDFGGKEGANDLLTLTRPDLIEQIHGRYFAAGCDVVETNTFGSSRLKLDEYGVGHRTYEVNFRAAILARRAAERHATPDAAALRGRLDGPHRHAAVLVRPGAGQHHRRRAGADLLRAGQGADRGRRRRAHPRDPPGHAGAARRGAGRRRLPARAAARRLHHRPAHPHRPERPHAARHRHRQRAGDAGAAAGGRRRPQLLHRPRRDARGGALPRRALQPLRLGAAQRRHAGERRRQGGLQALPGRPGRGAGQLRRRVRRRHRGRLLRHHPGAPGGGGGAAGHGEGAAPGPPAPRPRAQLGHEGGAADAGAAPAGGRRAAQRPGLAQGEGAAARRRLPGPAADRPRPGRGRRPRARRLRGAQRARRRGGADARPGEAAGAGGRRAADDRLDRAGRHRVGAQGLPGTLHRQLHQPGEERRAGAGRCCRW